MTTEKSESLGVDQESYNDPRWRDAYWLALEELDHLYPAALAVNPFWPTTPTSEGR